MIYVADPGSNSLFVIHGKTNRILKSISLGNPNLSDDFEFSTEVAVNPKTNLVYLTNSDSNTLTIIDGRTSSIVKP